jgi:hypothetical protein
MKFFQRLPMYGSLSSLSRNLRSHCRVTSIRERCAPELQRLCSGPGIARTRPLLVQFLCMQRPAPAPMIAASTRLRLRAAAWLVRTERGPC